VLDLLRSLLTHNQPADFKDVLPFLRVILYSPALEQLVAQSPNKVDDLVLRILRALIPPDAKS
jgi:hypothetical protein